MIVSGGSRSKWRFFAKHLTNAKQNERVRVVEVRGLSAENVQDGFSEMAAMAAGSRRCKNFFYHADFNPRAEEHLTEEQWGEFQDDAENKLGLEGQPRMVVEHVKNGRLHRHIVWYRIDVDTGKAISDSNDFKKHQEISREAERKFGLAPVLNANEKGMDGRQTERRVKSWEKFRGGKSGLDPEAVKAEATALWQNWKGPEAFNDELRENGYILCKGDRRDFCIVDPAGDAHSLAKRLQGVRVKDVRERMAGLDRETLPTVAEGRAMANAESGDSKAAKSVRTHKGQVRALDTAERSKAAYDDTEGGGDEVKRRAQQEYKKMRGRLQEKTKEQPQGQATPAALKEQPEETPAPAPEPASTNGKSWLERYSSERNRELEPER